MLGFQITHKQIYLWWTHSVFFHFVDFSVCHCKNSGIQLLYSNCNGYRIRGYCPRFSLTLPKYFFKMTNITPSIKHITPSPPRPWRNVLTILIDDKNSRVTISTYCISIVIVLRCLRIWKWKWGQIFSCLFFRRCWWQRKYNLFKLEILNLTIS